MTRYSKPITNLKLKGWLAAGAVDRGVGEGSTFVASAPAARAGKASWILRFRLNSRSREKVLGRYPELSLKDAREHARQDRLRIERGIDVAAAKQAEKALVLEVPTVQRLGEVWFARYIQPRYKHPDVVARVLRKHINPVLGPVAPPDDCVRKMELLSARWDAFDLDEGVWTLARESTKTQSAIRIPLAKPVIAWLKEAKVIAFGKPFVFPARRLVRRRLGEARMNRYEHVGPDTLNVALKRLQVLRMEHFTVHDMRRTARTHLASLGVDRFVAERSLNHKLGNVEGVYDRHDYSPSDMQRLGPAQHCSPKSRVAQR